MRYWSLFCSEKFPNHMQISANLSKLHFFLLEPRNRNCCYINCTFLCKKVITNKKVSKMLIFIFVIIFLYKRVNLLCKFTFYCKKWTQLDKFVLSFCTKMYNLHNNTYTKLVINVPIVQIQFESSSNSCIKSNIFAVPFQLFWSNLCIAK